MGEDTLRNSVISHLAKLQRRNPKRRNDE